MQIEEFKNEDQHFAENVRREREKRGFSQAEMARRLREFGLDQFHPTTVSRVENGERPVRLSEAARFADILGTTVGKLVSNYIEEVEDLVEALAIMRELESRLVGSYDAYQAGRLTLRSEVENFKAWLSENPDIVQSASNGLIVEDLLSSATARIGKDAWKLLDEYERIQSGELSEEETRADEIQRDFHEDAVTMYVMPSDWDKDQDAPADVVDRMEAAGKGGNKSARSGRFVKAKAKAESHGEHSEA